MVMAKDEAVRGPIPRSGHHSPSSLVNLRRPQELLIKFVNLLGQSGLAKEQRCENIL